MFKIHLFGNCQMQSVKSILGLITNYKIINHRIELEKVLEVNENDLIFFHDMRDFKEQIIKSGTNAKLIIEIPILNTSIHMQDCVYSSRNAVKSPLNDYHSFIVLSSFLFGLTEEECYKLFNKTFYEDLGYFNSINQEKEKLKNLISKFGYKDSIFINWLSRERLNYSVNHPTLSLVNDIIVETLNQYNIPFKKINIDEYLIDPLKNNSILPILINHQSFKCLEKNEIYFRALRKGEIKLFSLKEFISRSYEIYKESKESLSTPLLDKDRDKYQDIFKKALKNINRNSKNKHPYSSKADYCYWKRSVTNIPYNQLDPVVESLFKFESNDKIATAGSCFAQHISRRLKIEGFNYYIPEHGPKDLTKEDLIQHNYGTFSCRYGNIYTTLQLNQLFDRAYNKFQPEIEVWSRDDGKYIDPFRPQVEPNGYDTVEKVIEDRNIHLENVKNMFENLDVFIFTLGLTEAWIYRNDGAVLPLAPGVAGGEYNEKDYIFKNFSTQEVKEDLISFIQKLKNVNPTARVLLTVSPVPLVATYEDRHVLVSTVSSKSKLRVAAEEVVNELDDVYYFPSYEIISSHYNKGRYFAEDLREVEMEGVNHVMSLVIKHMTDIQGSKYTNDTLQNLKQLETLSINNSCTQFNLNDIICDEEIIDNIN